MRWQVRKRRVSREKFNNAHLLCGSGVVALIPARANDRPQIHP